MKMAKLYEATGALVAGMDKKKATKHAASVAVANGNGAPHMRGIACIVAHPADRHLRQPSPEPMTGPKPWVLPWAGPCGEHHLRRPQWEWRRYAQ
jgi:hypothetical protein